MANNYIIGRTERVRELKALLQQKQAVYLSAFFYAGKTVLLDQLAKALEGTVLRFDMGRDDWNQFQSLLPRNGQSIRLQLKLSALLISVSWI